MKRLFQAFAIVALLFSASDAFAGKNSKETVTFQVPMKCHKCQAKIEENIAYEKGVTDLSVNLEEKKVTVTYKKKSTDEEKLKEAFKKLGYEVTVVEEEKKE